MKPSSPTTDKPPMHVIRFICLSLWLVFLLPMTSSAKDTPPVLTIEHGGRTIDGPVAGYTIKIYEHGTVHYHGDIAVKALGDRKGRITPRQVQQLISIHRKTDKVLKKWETDDRYDRLRPNDNHVWTTLQYQGEISKSFGGFTTDLVKALNKMLPIEKWI